MDDGSITDPYLSGPRLPLLTATEARELVGLLLHFDDGSEQGQAAGQWAADLARRLPAS